jgi:hypothetical protein
MRERVVSLEDVAVFHRAQSIPLCLVASSPPTSAAASST